MKKDFHQSCYEQNKKQININKILSDPSLSNQCELCKTLLSNNIKKSLLNKKNEIRDDWQNKVYKKIDENYYHIKCYEKNKNKLI